MKEDNTLYLREDAYIEPLINSWYAWSYLLHPVAYARHMIKNHKRIMKSFCNNYIQHQMAINAPGMSGSEFMDCSEEKIPMIEALIQDIDQNHGDLVELSDAVTTLDELLAEHPSGDSLEGLYEQIPAPLRGYVELVYDHRNNASFRLIEGLIYDSEMYKPSLQSLCIGTINRVGARPFVLSTPRLPDENHVMLDIQFCDSIIDKLSRARENPIDEGEVKEIFETHCTGGGIQYSDLFATEPPSYRYSPLDKELSVKYIGHAGFLLETPDVAILIDPVIASRGDSYKDEIISFSELPPRIDYICITHNHQDHINFETLLQLRYKTDKILVPKNNSGSLLDPSMKLILKNLNFDVIEVDDMEQIDIPDGQILSIPFLGEHGDLNIRSKTAWFFELKGKKMMFMADSANLDSELYKHVKKRIGDIDILAIGMECVGAPFTWIYGALFTTKVSKRIKDSRRLNGSNHVQATSIIETLSPKDVYIYALGLEPWYKYFMGVDYQDDSEQIVQSKKLLAYCEEKQINADMLYGKREISLD